MVTNDRSKLSYFSGGLGWRIYALPVFSRTIVFNDLRRAKMRMPPIKAAITRMRKNIFLSVKSFQKLVITPAILPPIEVERNHPPISKAVNLAGASFDTSDKPIGLKKISLIVNTK